MKKLLLTVVVVASTALAAAPVGHAITTNMRCAFVPNFSGIQGGHTLCMWRSLGPSPSPQHKIESGVCYVRSVFVDTQVVWVYRGNMVDKLDGLHPAQAAMPIGERSEFLPGVVRLGELYRIDYVSLAGGDWVAQADTSFCDFMRSSGAPGTDYGPEGFGVGLPFGPPPWPPTD